MDQEQLRVLAVQDSQEVLFSILENLKEGGFAPQASQIQNRREFMASLKKGEWDVILCDYTLENFSALEALEIIRDLERDLPLIVISGTRGEEAAVECMKAGAYDYIMKDKLARLVPAIEREIKEKGRRKSQKETREALKESQALTESIFEAAVDAIITIDEKGKVLSFNPAAEKLFGYPREEILGENIKILMPSPHYERHDNYLENYLETGEKKIIGLGREVRGRRKDGTTFPAHISVSEVKLEKKIIFTGILHDISHRKKVEKALKESELKFKNLYNSAPVMYFTQNKEGVIVDVNKTTLEKLDYKHSEMVDQPLSKFLEKSSRASLEKAYKKLDGNTYTTQPMGLYRKDGEVLEVILTLSREYDTDKREIGLKTAAIDVTETRKLQKQLVHADRLSSIGRLAAGISHEINQPLACISMSSEIMLNKLAKDLFQKELFESELEDIMRQLERINKIIQNIKTFSREFSHDSKKEVDVNQVLRTAISLIKRQFEKQKILISTHFAPSLPTIRGDMFRLEQVFVNLLLNAKDALEEKSKTSDKDEEEEKKISLETELTDGQIAISIRDTGTGIQSENIDKIFDPFYTTKEVGIGTGLGLSISYGIITEMNGQIQCNSVPGEYTEFIITLPANSTREDQKEPHANHVKE